MILGGVRPASPPAYRPCRACLVNVATRPHDPGGETCQMLAGERAAKIRPLPGDAD